MLRQNLLILKLKNLMHILHGLEMLNSSYIDLLNYK